MTTIDNIMKLADAYKDAAESQTYMDQSGSMYQWKVAKEKAEESREALRTALTEALAAQPVREPQCVAKITVYDNHWKLEYLSLPVGTHKLYAQQYSYSAPSEAQPVREPVAWWITSKTTDDKFVTTRPDDWSNVNWDKHPLYMGHT